MKRFCAVLLSSLILTSSLCTCSNNSEPVNDSVAESSQAADVTNQTADNNAPVQEKIGSVINKINSDEKEYTLMVYMNGSDLESRSMAASIDIEEMLGSNLDTSKVNLVLYTGGTETWHLNIPNTGNSTFLMDNQGMILQGLSEKPVNMGDSDTLSTFLNESYQNFPARHYGLIFWDHGSGPLLGFGKDQNFDDDSLELNELQTALDHSPFDKDHKLDFVGFDACLMSSVEIANVFKDYASYLIASQETEPSMGWDYSFLSAFNQTSDPVSISDQIIQTYHTYYNEIKTEKFSPQLTLSCMDLSKTDKLNAALDDLFSSMDTSIKRGNFSKRVAERMTFKSFGEGSVKEKGCSMDMIDIGDMADVCSTSFATETKAVKEAMGEFVIHNQSNIPCSNGVSLYYPFNGPYVYAFLGRSRYTQFKGSTQYSNYINTFTNAWSKEWLSSDENQTIEHRNYSLGKAELNKELYSIQLTDEQQKNYSRAYLHIFTDKIGEYGDQGYFPLLTYVPLEKTKDGIISFDINQKIPIANESYFPLQQLSGKDGYNEYQSIFSKVMVNLAGMPYTATEDVRILCSTQNDSDEITINSMEYDDPDQSLFLGKNTLDSEHWPQFDSVLKEYVPKTNSDGGVQPLSQWEPSGTSVFVSTDNDEKLVFKMQSLDTLDEADYYYQVVMEGIHGELYSTEMLSASIGTKSYDYTESFGDKGKATYKIYPDHAELRLLEGTEKSYTVPDKVKNVPVTIIGQKCLKPENSIDELTITNPDTRFRLFAFSNAAIKKLNLPDHMEKIDAYSAFSYSDLEEVNIPSSVKSISSQAFIGCSRIKKLRLPSGIEDIGYGAFAGCVFDEISFDGSNTHYMLEGKNLYSKDGKILYGRYEDGDTYSVKEGVEEIAPFACYGMKGYGEDYKVLYTNTLRHITLPDSLKIIDYNAFSNSELITITIPDNVTDIGHNAFANYNFSSYKDNLQYPDPIKEIHLGKGVKWIGKEILGNNTVEKCTVSDDNDYYSSKNNKLFNKAGDSEIQLTDIIASSH